MAAYPSNMPPTTVTLHCWCNCCRCHAWRRYTATYCLRQCFCVVAATAAVAMLRGTVGRRGCLPGEKLPGLHAQVHMVWVHTLNYKPLRLPLSYLPHALIFQLVHGLSTSAAPTAAPTATRWSTTLSTVAAPTTSSSTAVTSSRCGTTTPRRWRTTTWPPPSRSCAARPTTS